MSDDELQKQMEQEKYRNMQCRMYENEFPQKNDLVYCKITKLTETGAYVYLLEYGKEGLLFSSEITLKRVNYINRVLSVGKDEVLQVLNVDPKKGYIDLSKKQVKADAIEECKKKYSNSKKVEDIVKKLAVHTNNTMETIYKKLIWPLYKTHKHALDALKEILAGNKSILDGLKVDENIKEELMKILKEKLVPQPLKIRADFKLTCYTFEGIDAIKEALMNGEKKGTEKIPIKFTILGSPLYECSLTAINKEEGINLMNQALEEVKNSIKAKGGSYLLETKPMVLGEGEKSLAEQLKEAKNKEKEDEEGEEEEDDEEEEEDEESTKKKKKKKKHKSSTVTESTHKHKKKKRGSAEEESTKKRHKNESGGSGSGVSKNKKKKKKTTKESSVISSVPNSSSQATKKKKKRH